MTNIRPLTEAEWVELEDIDNLLDTNYIKDIPGYEGYYGATKYGDIISYGGKSNHKEDIVLSKAKDKDGYNRVTLQKNKERKYFRVARLIATTFIPNPMSLPFVNHIDENKNNDSGDDVPF